MGRVPASAPTRLGRRDFQHFGPRNRSVILYDRHVSQVTHILEAIQQGNPKAAEELLPLVARCGVTSAAGKFMLAAVMLAATFVFALLPVSGVPGHSQGQQDNDSESKV